MEAGRDSPAAGAEQEEKKTRRPREEDEGDAAAEQQPPAKKNRWAEEETDARPVVKAVAPKPAVHIPAIHGCRFVDNVYEKLNSIDEGTYGFVFRARNKLTGEVVALKKLKLEKEKEGFPITSLREINTLLRGKHENVVGVREIVVGPKREHIFVVMDFVEHDLKSLMETMKQPFLQGEVKTLMLQLLRGISHLHDNWIIHRDLKTSNLLLSHGGILKIADFGLAREYGDPLRPMTPTVVTLWYRAPELLLGAREYSTPIDMWSIGCIFAELLTHHPLFQGRQEIEQLNLIFKLVGTPNEQTWPGFSELPNVKRVSFNNYPSTMRAKFPPDRPPYLTSTGFSLLQRLLYCDPAQRLRAEDALRDNYFTENPRPVDPEFFPTWPAKSEGVRKRTASPSAPEGGGGYELEEDARFMKIDPYGSNL